MKKYLTYIIYILIVLAIAVVSVDFLGKNEGASNSKDTSFIGDTGDTRDTFFAGSTYTTSLEEKASDDDIYVIAEAVTIDENIRGDSFTVSGELDIEEDVFGGVYSISENVTIGGNINNDIHSLVGNSFKLEDNTKVRGDILVLSDGHVRLFGDITGDVLVFARSISIKDASIGGVVKLSAEHIEITGDSVLEGETFIQAPIEAVLIGETVSISGDVVYGEKSVLSSGNILLDFISVFVTAFLLAMVLSLVSKNFNMRIQKVAFREVRTSFKFLAYLLVIFIGIGLIATGILVAVIPHIAAFLLIILAILFALFIVILLLAYASFPGFLGQAIKSMIGKEMSTLNTILIGSLALALISQILIIGAMILFFVGLYLLGSVFYAIWSSINQAS